MVMVLHSYTKWSGMSCWNKWIMVSHGQEKGRVLEKTDKMVVSLKVIIKLFLPFSIKI